MKCPADGTTLQMSERSGIEIDYCPECRGVWLDRGELDKIIAKSIEHDAPQAQQQPQQAPPPPQQPQGQPWGAPQPPAYPPPPGYPPQHGGYYGHKYKRPKSFIEKIFD